MHGSEWHDKIIKSRGSVAMAQSTSLYRVLMAAGFPVRQGQLTGGSKIRVLIISSMVTVNIDSIS